MPMRVVVVVSVHKYKGINFAESMLFSFLQPFPAIRYSPGAVYVAAAQAMQGLLAVALPAQHLHTSPHPALPLLSGLGHPSACLDSCSSQLS
jgi:hypothetical protein